MSSVQPAKATEIPYLDPAQAFLSFAGDPFALFFDSSLQDEKRGRYAFIAARPCITLTAKNGICAVNGKPVRNNPFATLKTLLSPLKQETLEGVPPFQGGGAGYFGYDLCRHLEKLPAPPMDDFRFPDMAVGIYDTVASFDLFEKRAWIVSSVPEKAAGLGESLESARDHLLPDYTTPQLSWHTNFTAENYKRTVRQVIEYIHAGDIFQANLSQRFTATLPAGFDPYALYLKLRSENPASFSGFQNFGDFQIASSSPERFLNLHKDQVETRPIKGTRPRGHTPAQDQALAEILLNSEKDCAENAMIVDLLRNDLSRVCQDHTVNVPELCGLESFATVHHLVSTVTAQLRADMGPVDLLEACFPGGSITGAPKVRAMEIIAELEPNARGPYCGAMGYVGFDKTMDTNIAIRTLCFKDNEVSFQTGGGIVADSDPAAEYEETLDKARALFSCFENENIRKSGT